MSEFKVISLFSGVGGFDLAFRNMGAKTILFSEIDSSAQGVLRRHFPGIENIPDVREVQYNGQVDIVAGGFPCQDISLAGKRAGLAGEKSRLWWEFHRVIEETQPRFALIENVAGLLSSGSPAGSDMGAILGSLADIGYMGEYRVLDSKFFGVPQQRRRVFILARNFGSPSESPILLDTTSLQGNNKEDNKNKENFASDTLESVKPCGWKGKRIGTLTTAFGSKNYSNAQEVSQGSIQPYEDEDGCRVRRLSPIEMERLQGFPDDWTKWDEKGKEISATNRIKFMGNAVTVPVVEAIAKRIINEVTS